MDILKKLNITTLSTYIPHRTPAGESPQLKWRVSVRRDGFEFHSTEYFWGSAYAPSHKQGSGTITQAVRDECETGMRQDGTPVPAPQDAEIVACLVLETRGADETFEEWAAEAGYDPDSRAAESIYRECQQTSAAMRKTFTADELAALSEAFADN